MFMMSEKELGKKWDRCLADGAIKFGKYPKHTVNLKPINLFLRRGNRQFFLV